MAETKMGEAPDRDQERVSAVLNRAQVLSDELNNTVKELVLLLRQFKETPQHDG